MSPLVGLGRYGLCACRVRHIRRRPAAVLVSANSAGMSREAVQNSCVEFLFTSSGKWQPSPVAARHPLPSDGRGTSPMEPLPRSNGPDHFLSRFRFFIQNVMFHSQSTIPVFPMEVLGRCYAGVSDRAMVFYGGIFQPPRHQGIFSCLPAFLVILKNAVQPRINTDGHGYQAFTENQRFTRRVNKIAFRNRCLSACIRGE